MPRVFERIHNQILMVRRKMTKKKGYFFDWAAEVGWRRFCKENGLPVEHTARECLDFIMWPYLKRKIADPVKGVFGNRINVLRAAPPLICTSRNSSAAWALRSVRPTV